MQSLHTYICLQQLTHCTPVCFLRHIGPASRLRWADPEALLHAQRSDTAHATDAAAAALLAALRLALAQQAALELVREREAGHESSSDEEVSWQGAESDSDSRSSVTTHAQLTQAEESLNSELESHLSHPDDPLKARALIAKAISAAAGICLGTTGSAQQSTAAAAAAAAPSLGRAWAVYVLMAWCGVDAPAHVIDAIADAVNIVLAEVTSQVGVTTNLWPPIVFTSLAVCQCWRCNAVH
jgi:hypothetical protein